MRQATRTLHQGRGCAAGWTRPELSLMPSQCMDDWYTSTFLKGDMSPAPCDDDFEEYQLCVVAAHREWVTGEKVIEDDGDDRG